jgi:hypothetical protein
MADTKKWPMSERPTRMKKAIKRSQESGVPIKGRSSRQNKLKNKLTPGGAKVRTRVDIALMSGRTQGSQRRLEATIRRNRGF